MSILSHFSKGIKKSAALSFSLSASSNCEDICRQKSGGCYALQPEKRYMAYGKKLNRHGRTLPHNLVKKAYKEVKNQDITWFRFSVSGSLPNKNQVSGADWVKFGWALCILCKLLLKKGVKIHLPVESMGKARSYRKILSGLPIVVRRTIQDKRNLLNFEDKCSYVVGDTPNPGNAGVALALAKIMRGCGKTVVVCPAIVGNSKCGKCTACAEPVDLILYPKH